MKLREQLDLSQPVDVVAEWVDSAEANNYEHPPAQQPRRNPFENVVPAQPGRGMRKRMANGGMTGEAQAEEDEDDDDDELSAKRPGGSRAASSGSEGEVERADQLLAAIMGPAAATPARKRQRLTEGSDEEDERDKSERRRDQFSCSGDDEE